MARYLTLDVETARYSTRFAKLGMNVLGIDFSQEQINSAKENQLKSRLNTLQFRCVDIVNFDETQFKDHLIALS